MQVSYSKDMDNLTISRRNIVIGFICIFIFAPLIAFLLASQTLKRGDNIPTFTPPSRDKEMITTAIARDRKDLGDSSYQDIAVNSFERIDSNWYIVKGSIKSDSKPVSAILLIGDFYYNPKKMVVIINPNQSFYRLNTSKDGVPYGVIDKIRSLKSSQGEHHD